MAQLYKQTQRAPAPSPCCVHTKATPEMASSRWSTEPCPTLCSCFELSSPYPPWHLTRTWRHTLTLPRSLFPGPCRTLRAPGGQPGWSPPRAAGGAVASAPLSTAIHSLAPQLLRVPPSSGVCGVCMQRDSDFQGCGLASVQIHMVSGTGLSWSVVLDQWPPGLGVQPLVRGAPDRR